jgi:hypothetical protein
LFHTNGSQYHIRKRQNLQIVEETATGATIICHMAAEHPWPGLLIMQLLFQRSTFTNTSREVSAQQSGTITACSLH